jgi:hypothetical protein
MPIKHLLPENAEHSIVVYGHMLLVACAGLMKLNPELETVEEAMVYCYVRARVAVDESKIWDDMIEEITE